MKSETRKYIKADDGKFVEIGGENGHASSVRKILYQRHNRRDRRYGWIHGHQCMFCGMDSKFFKKSPCPATPKVTESADDLMDLHLTPKLEMSGMLESWS